MMPNKTSLRTGGTENEKFLLTDAVEDLGEGAAPFNFCVIYIYMYI